MSVLLAEHEVVLDHGTGAKLSQDLIAHIARVLGDVYLGEMEDAAILPVADGPLALTTDSFVIDPFIFGNGDIGKVSVCGTVNDLAVMGAKPLYLTLGLILETGLKLDDFTRVLESIRETAREAGVSIVAGDTKVVAPGEADKIFINTTGVGVLSRPALRMTAVQPGDKVLLSSHIGDHSIHLLSMREGLGFESRVPSDCAPLNHMIADLLAAGEGRVRSIRDVTRGGLAAVMHEYARKLPCRVTMRAGDLPIRHEVAMAADMLGINPIHLANEGCLALFVAPEFADEALAIMHAHPYGVAACAIGEVRSGDAAVVLSDDAGGETVLDEMIGAELPRLC
jgi:hydrogenase expression/formation protein HypE